MENNNSGPAIGSFIVLAILIIGAIYVLINTLNTRSSSPTVDTLQATTTVPTSTTTGQVN